MSVPKTEEEREKVSESQWHNHTRTQLWFHNKLMKSTYKLKIGTDLIKEGAQLDHLHMELKAAFNYKKQ